MLLSFCVIRGLILYNLSDISLRLMRCSIVERPEVLEAPRAFGASPRVPEALRTRRYRKGPRLFAVDPVPIDRLSDQCAPCDAEDSAERS